MEYSHVSFENVVKSYGATTVIPGFSLNISEGEFVTIVGPSGSGKTTLLKLLSGFEFPTDGKILLSQRDVTFSPPHKRNIGMVFQNYALFPHMNVFDNVAFPLEARKFDKNTIKKRVYDALEKAHITGVEKKYPSQLSGGQRQRVALARSFVFEPEILLLDEPVSALDKKVRLEVQTEIVRLHKDIGITTINVTHDQEEALNMSDRICVLNNGAIEQVGKPTDVYNQPANLFVATFIGETNILLGSAGKIIGQYVEVVATSGDVFRGIPRQALRPGDLVHICFRPERFRVGNPHSDFNDFLLRTITHQYKGDKMLVKAATEKGAEITLQVSGHDLEWLSSELRRVLIDPNDIYIFKRT